VGEGLTSTVICVGIPAGLVTLVFLLIVMITRRSVRGAKQIAASDDYYFFEDIEGRILRKQKSFRNIAAYLIFISMLIGAGVCAVSSINEGNWQNLILSLLFAGIPISVLVYLWRIRRGPYIVFDAPLASLRLRQDRLEEQISFDHIVRFNIAYRPMKDPEGGNYPKHGHYEVSMVLERNRIIEIATFSGKNKSASTRAEKLVSKLENLVQPTESISKNNQMSEKVPERVIDVRHRLVPGGEKHIDLIKEQIEKIQQHDRGSFVIFETDARKNYYIQLLNTGNDTIYAEASTAATRTKKIQLNDSQNHKLVELGWMYPQLNEINYQRDWLLTTDEHRERVAELILVTFMEVYGFETNQAINVKEELL
jgi:hypothetical protein